MKRLTAGLLLCAGLACQAASVPEQAQVIPLSMYLDAIPSFEGTVAGQAGRFLLDTAGGLSVIAPRFAGAVGCTPWARITGYRMRGDRLDLARCDAVPLKIGALALPAATVGVWDFSQILPKDAPPLQGSIALDAFAGQALTLDLSARQLIIETPATLQRRIAQAQEVEVRFSRDAQGLALTPLVAVETPQGKLWMELDTGSDAPMIVAQHGAGALGLEASLGKKGQALKAMLAGGVPIETQAIVQDLILDGNIGEPVLRHWIITMDLARQKLWIAQKR